MKALTVGGRPEQGYNSTNQPENFNEFSVLDTGHRPFYLTYYCRGEAGVTEDVWFMREATNGNVRAKKLPSPVPTPLQGCLNFDWRGSVQSRRYQSGRLCHVVSSSNGAERCDSRRSHEIESWSGGSAKDSMVFPFSFTELSSQSYSPNSTADRYFNVYYGSSEKNRWSFPYLICIPQVRWICFASSSLNDLGWRYEIIQASSYTERVVKTSLRNLWYFFKNDFNKKLFWHRI